MESQEEKQNLDTILLMLSSGVGNAYTLYWYLTETEHPIHVHYISQRQKISPCWGAEDEATRNIVDFCLSHYRPFDYSESRFDFPFDKYIGSDSDFDLVVAARVVPNLPGERVTVALDWSQEDDYLNPPHLIKERLERKVSANFWKALCASIHEDKNVNPEFVVPLEDMKLSTTDIVRKLPPELLALCWSCRSPRVIRGKFIPCGDCHSCKKIKAAHENIAAQRSQNTAKI